MKRIKYTGTMNQVGKDIVKWRKSKKFETSWENMQEKLLLLHSEISEAAEALRNDNIENFKEELADIQIRLLDATSSTNIDIELEVRKKMLKNEERPIRHGKRF